MKANFKGIAKTVLFKDLPPWLKEVDSTVEIDQFYASSQSYSWCNNTEVKDLNAAKNILIKDETEIFWLYYLGLRGHSALILAR